MFVLENTAVNSRKNTRITIMSIIGTMLRSLRPLVLRVIAHRAGGKFG